MMRSLLFLFLLFHNALVYSLTIDSAWNSDFKKIIKVQCLEEDRLVCLETCGFASLCEVEETPCRDCLGSGIYLTYLFNEVGKVIQSTGQKVDPTELINLLRSKDFTTLTSRSVFNHVQRFDSLSLRLGFQKLCSDATEYPILFLDKDTRNGELGALRFVWCENGLFEVAKVYDTE